MPSALSLPVVRLRRAAAHPPAAPTRESRRLIDSRGRTIRDLRLSITDRCNFRCVYCMDPGVRFADPAGLLSADELARLARVAVTLGVERIRLTGGEPTVHPQLIPIIQRVAAIGLKDLSMTTNGALVTPASIAEWKRAGLRRLTFSLDAVSPAVFRALTRSNGDAARVIDAIAAAIDAGLSPVKVNAVVIRGVNEGEIPALAALGREVGFEMRFIEFMPLDSGRRWDPSLLVPADEIIRRAGEAGDLVALGREETSSTSETFVFAGDPLGRASPARVGVIAPVTRPFCGACSRLRITADGKVRPCLFSLQEFDLMPLVRGSASDDAIADALLDAVWSKQAGHGITAPGFRPPERTMSAIGG